MSFVRQALSITAFMSIALGPAQAQSPTEAQTEAFVVSALSEAEELFKSPYSSGPPTFSFNAPLLQHQSYSGKWQRTYALSMVETIKVYKEVNGEGSAHFEDACYGGNLPKTYSVIHVELSCGTVNCIKTDYENDGVQKFYYSDSAVVAKSCDTPEGMQRMRRIANAIKHYVSLNGGNAAVIDPDAIGSSFD